MLSACGIIMLTQGDLGCNNLAELVVGHIKGSAFLELSSWDSQIPLRKFFHTLGWRMKA